MLILRTLPERRVERRTRDPSAELVEKRKRAFMLRVLREWKTEAELSAVRPCHDKLAGQLVDHAAACIRAGTERK